MGKQFGSKRGMKRKGVLKNFSTSKQTKKTRLIEQKTTRDRSLTVSGDLSEDEFDASAVSTASDIVQNTSSVCDNLLTTLQSCSNKSLTEAYKKRQKQEATSDSESKEDADQDGIDDDAKLEEDEGASDSDQECSMAVNAQVSTSSFHAHLGHNLSKGEVQDLLMKKWEYKWEVPAFGKLDCKWVGTGECFLKGIDENSRCGLKERLYNHWLDCYKKSGGNDFHSSEQRFFFSLCNSYRDVLHSNKKPFYLKSRKEDLSIKDAYIMHSLNHIFSAGDVIRKNDAKLAKHKEHAGDELPNFDGFLDHGFTRPKVLVLLPFRSIALRVVKALIQLTPQSYKVNIEHADRFYDEFGTRDDEDGIDGDKRKSSKPSDHQELFRGNNDDNFMIGIKFTRRSIKLYSDFYSSDMIIASPLALHTRIEEAVVNKEKDFDFLSSIEVLIIDHADVIALQNWNYLRNVLEHLNGLPSKQHGTDIMRIRKWYVEKHARYYRQTIVLAHYVNPDINASFNHQCTNYKGKVKLVCNYKGVISKVEHQVRQVYERLDVNSIADADDARHEYFVKKVFPKIKDSDKGGIMLFVSSYFEYVKLRNYLKSQNASFCAVADYTKQSDVSRARLQFFKKEKKIMLYTERRHFYNRYKIRGINNLVIYSLPDRMDFYPEMINMLEEDSNNDMSCTVLFSKFDQFRLERIVGSAHAKRLVTSEKSTFLFC